ncbi:hypothetical protein PAAG_11117 [Paracoccidioides lutzii Pb01]|uniref:Uncharacterized protein n=1 Tax=Paracoccidioides lutzii (strain ATCC MYA-826 / Pb01) TaxID=502779 RepID=A0A0A2V798_PARBA|nr:hypothetical protein PAAG_11117 [Paracoccidioides lutzii Pb01]KGQ02162.1 hypothetical protein PAAG_11117 [Paracoccidioides lutzii Pb01]
MASRACSNFADGKRGEGGVSFPGARSFPQGKGLFKYDENGLYGEFCMEGFCSPQLPHGDLLAPILTNPALFQRLLPISYILRSPPAATSALSDMQDMVVHLDKGSILNADLHSQMPATSEEETVSSLPIGGVLS